MMTEKQKLAPCEADINDIEYIVCHVGLLWRRLINAKIKSLGVSGTEKRILFCVLRNPGCTQVQIASLLDLEPQNIIRVLDKLEQQQWLEKQASPQDRRVKLLYITADGKKIIAQIKKITDELKPHVLNNLDEKKIAMVVGHLSSMRENLFKQIESIEV